jgi:hypothetical protein
MTRNAKRTEQRPFYPAKGLTSSSIDASRPALSSRRQNRAANERKGIQSKTRVQSRISGLSVLLSRAEHLVRAGRGVRLRRPVIFLGMTTSGGVGPTRRIGHGRSGSGQSQEDKRPNPSIEWSQPRLQSSSGPGAELQPCDSSHPPEMPCGVFSQGVSYLTSARARPAFVPAAHTRRSSPSPPSIYAPRNSWRMIWPATSPRP